MKRTAVALAVSFFVLGGCAPTHSVRISDEEVRARVGPMPDQAKAEEAILKDLRPKLKDPDSVKQFRIVSGPIFVNHDVWVGLLYGGTRHVEGWLYCAEYNAKNSYGAYGGVERMAFLLISNASRAGLGGDPWVVESSRGCS